MSTVPRFSPFVQIKDGREKPPIFIAHGMGGSAQFGELAKHIRTGNPIYGIQAQGVDGMAEPLESVEDMAQLYLDALEELYPEDPYILIGYSFGGLVALEMAQRLLEKGKKIALLVMLDTYPHQRFLPPSRRLRWFLRRMRSHASQIRDMPYPRALSYFGQGVRRRLHFPGSSPETQRPETMGLSFAEKALRRVHQKGYVAYAKYRPRFYPRNVKFVTTEIKSFFPADPAAVWSALVSDFEVEAIPGHHLTIVTTEFEGLASVLTRYIKDVPTQNV